jgi:hypothetical protein
MPWRVDETGRPGVTGGALPSGRAELVNLLGISSPPMLAGEKVCVRNAV